MEEKHNFVGMASEEIFNMMHPFDLIKQLKVEFQWTQDFATKAFYEYYRWMRLRVHCGDLSYCNLPPSDIIASVWEVHRQYTHDYQYFCAGFGVYLHHFPPAMRKGKARMMAYRLTLKEYKSFYGEDPPALCWNVTTELDEDT